MICEYICNLIQLIFEEKEYLFYLLNYLPLNSE